MNHPFSAEHLNILQSQCVTLEVMADYTSIQHQNTYTNYTPAVAINNYVAIATTLQSINLDAFRYGVNFTNIQLTENIEQLMFYMIQNGKGTLLYYIDLTQQLFFQEVSNALSSKIYTITIILIVDPIIIIALLMLFIPFILKVQSNLLKIYVHLCQFKNADLKNWLEQCNNSAADIKTSTAKLKKIYDSENFEVTTVAEIEEKKNQEKEIKEEKKGSCIEAVEETPDNKQNITTLKSTESPFNTHIPDETQELIQKNETAVSERKEKMFSKMTKDKTKAYLFSLLIFTIFIGIFRTADALVFSDLDTNLIPENIISKLSQIGKNFIQWESFS